MSFASILATVSGKRPAWLYEFRRNGAVERFTRSGREVQTAKADFFADADVFKDSDWFRTSWFPKAITHTRFMKTGALARETTEIVMPQSDTFAAAYLGDLTYSQNTLIVSQVFLNDPDLEVVNKFKGRVVAASPKLTRVVLKAENRFTELRAKAMTKVLQRRCTNVLYFKPSGDGGGCGASLTANQTDATASAINDLVVTCAEAASQPNGFYSNGIIQWNGIRQMIVKHSGSSLTLIQPLEGLAEAIANASQSVKIARGCNLTRTHCKELGQLDNFGGFPYMSKSPYNGENIF